MLALTAKRSFSFTYPCPRRLREIMKMSAIEKETPSTIEMIWKEYHNAKPHTVSRVLNQTLYLQLLNNAQHSKMFIFPVPKEGGHFMMLSQSQQKSFILTYLEDFKKNPLSANPYFVITCFDELVRTKGVALLRADIIGTFNKEEGQTLLNTVINSYLVETNFEKVRKFNHEPSQFNYEEYTQEAIINFKRELDVVKQTKTDPIDIGKAAKNDWNVFKL